ncbi:MAG: rhomboid family intramembrane serine protease [Eubacteriales bacterium]|nr:rhomboid family intramembrane serine protease [Eubacteriales bacterium]
MYQKKAPCTAVLVGLNVVVFLFLSFQGMTEDAGFMLQHGAMYVPDIVYEEKYYELFTSMFLHFGFEHLMNNMLVLIFIGYQLEYEVGGIKYVLIYILSGLGGNFLSLVFDLHTGDYAVSAGASGAIFGIIGALCYIAVRNHGRVGRLSGRGLLFMVALTLYLGFTSTGVDNFAHIGGVVSGFLLAVLLYRKNRKPEAYS